MTRCGLAAVRRRCRLGLLGVALLAVVSLEALAQRGTAEVFDARVSRVVDGDTLWVKPLGGGRFRKLRLDGLDAPEICQAGGTASREALASRVLKQVVTVRVRGFDVYDRALVQVEHRGVDVGAALVLDGHAWTYRWQNDPGLYPAEEERARGARKGVFADANAEAPWAFRRRYGPCLRN
jgi:endonuclease YncB( thermonuclease family)